MESSGLFTHAFIPGQGPCIRARSQSVGKPRSLNPIISPSGACRRQTTIQIWSYCLDDLAVASLTSERRLVATLKIQYFATGLPSRRFFRLHWLMLYYFCSSKFDHVCRYGHDLYSKRTLRVSKTPVQPKDAHSHYNKRLQHYLRQMIPRAPSYALSEGQCHFAFQHWVAYVRSGHSSDVTVKEHLRCPLLWCRESFDDLASTLQHVSKCPWLSNTWYWCPYCCRPESFMASEGPYKFSRQNKVQRKDSKLRRAVTFFKHLGQKSCVRHRTSGSTATHESESFDMWFDTYLAEQRQSEMEDTSPEILMRAELADSSSGISGRYPFVTKQPKNVYEMEVTTIDTPQDPDTLSQYTQEANSTSQPHELIAEPLVTGPQFKAELANPADTFMGLGAQFEGSPYDVEPRREMLVSPVSAISLPSNHQSTELITSAHVELDSKSLAHSGSETLSSPKVVDHHGYHNEVDPTVRVSPRPPEYDGNLHDDATSSTQSPVIDLRETVRVLNEEWLRRCPSRSDLLLRASAFSPQILFDKGAQSLQLVFQGVIPSTFDAVFSLAHFACAAAYIVHGDDRLHCWNEFFQHVLDLQNLIHNESDARLFVQLVNLLWWHQCSSAQRFCGNYFLDESSGTLVPLRRPVVGMYGLSLTETIALQKSRCPAEPASMTILKSLKDGAVLQECSRFLDRKPTYQHLSNKP